MTRLQKILTIIAGFAFLLCAISYLPFFSQRAAPRAFQSALLNSSYKDEVNEIVIDSGGKQIRLTRHLSDWTVADGVALIPAEGKLAENLLHNVIKLRKMYTISDTSMGTSEPFLSVLFGNGSNMYTKVDFFKINSLTNRISFSLEGKPEVYECEDDFSHYLQSDLAYWARPSLIQLLSNPVAFIWQEEGEKIRTFAENSEFFDKKKHDLMVLRHGLLLSPDAAGESPSDEAARLTVSDVNANSEIISFLPLKDGSFRCEYRWIFLSTDGRGADIADDLHFAYEISAWTYRRLREIFTLD